MAHEMFNIYYTNVVRPGLYTVYHNLDAYTGKHVRLCSNRKEAGLHYRGSKAGQEKKLLLSHWQSDFVHFPIHPRRIEITGQVVQDL